MFNRLGTYLEHRITSSCGDGLKTGDRTVLQAPSIKWTNVSGVAAELESAGKVGNLCTRQTLHRTFEIPKISCTFVFLQYVSHFEEGHLKRGHHRVLVTASTVPGTAI